MLVLTRKIGDSVVIGDAIHCTVFGYHAGEVKLGFDAPRIVPVHREEIQRLIWQEQLKNQGLEQFNRDKENVLERLMTLMRRGHFMPFNMPLSA